MFGQSKSKQDLIVHSSSPLNAEPPLDRLRRRFVTDVDDFYVRCHGNQPEIDAEAYRVTVSGSVGTPMELSLADLRARFTPRTVMAVMQCAGNLRADMQQVRPTTGDPWAPGAIGNAEWTGVALRDVLLAACADTDPRLHVAFESVDLAENDGGPDAPYGV